ncbi:MAG: photosynthetic reaction center cytochrome PufC [Rhodovarius sp.]|nr:photosynthetic reaction center cytochrome PufC [Rhodovarius sp.]MDW8314928.1 photosynthetic reaction center cytochrome PufC [Rhodovarius sp.]
MRDNTTNNTLLALGGVGALIGIGLLFTFERPPIETVQGGFRGTSMGQVYNPRTVNRLAAVNQVPPAPEPADPGGERARDVFQNVQVLGHLSVEQFNRIMQVMTEWIYPRENIADGCNGCHVPGNFAAEDIYTKHVARRMLQMTMALNSTWQVHTQEVGVTCWTCHRGQAVPAYVWSQQPVSSNGGGFATGPGEQNRPGRQVGLASLPNDPFTPYLWRAEEIRMQGRDQHPRPNSRQSIQQTEWNYALMMHMSTALGVNCTFCHNSRAFSSWEESPPQRLTAWHGIRMVRDINNTYIEPLRERFPPHRLGPLGDTLKVNCATCHQGVYQPMFGAPMIRDYPELLPPPEQRRAEAPAPGWVAGPRLP